MIAFRLRRPVLVFVYLTAAYDNVWHRGPTCKLLRLLPDRRMVRLIMEMVGNRSFSLTHRKGSRLRRLTVLDDATIEWLLNTCSEIYCGQAVD